MVTSEMKAALLPDRGVVKIAGADARKYLQGLLTADLAKVAPGDPAFAALLTPQGKIIADFIVVEAQPADGGGFFLDCASEVAPALTAQLNRYRLRASVLVEDLAATLGVMAIWDGGAGAAVPRYGLCYRDPRLRELGMRCMLAPQRAEEARASAGATAATAADYEAHRIALGVPRGGIDFAYNDAFPHETDMDQLNGIDFEKGCFVGQEVVSRMEHRGIARTRVVPIAYEGAAPAAGTTVTALGKPMGTVGSSANGRALAALRLDRVKEALEGGGTLVAGATAIHPIKPAWARFAFPGEATAAE